MIYLIHFCTWVVEWPLCFCTMCMLHIAIFRFKNVWVYEKEHSVTHWNVVTSKLWYPSGKIWFLFIILRRMWMNSRVAHGAQRQQKYCTKKKANIYQKTNCDIPLSQNMSVSFGLTNPFVSDLCLYFWCPTFAHLCCKNRVQKPSAQITSHSFLFF